MEVLTVLEILVVPGLLVWAFIVAGLTPGRLSRVRSRRAARAGFWFGPVVVTIGALVVPPGPPWWSAGEVDGFDGPGGLLGLSIGLMLPVVFRRVRRHEDELPRSSRSPAAPVPRPATQARPLPGCPSVMLGPERDIHSATAGCSRIGLLTLALSTASAWLLFTYVIAPQSREFAAAFALSAALGLLIQLVMNPDLSIDAQRPPVRQL